MSLRTRKDDLARFWSKVDREGPIPSHDPSLGRCWVWTAATTRDGYGRFWFEGSTGPAHRWIVEQSRGPIPRGFEPDHLCRNRTCVNPAHIEVVTQRENLRRAGFLRRGRAIGNAAVQSAKTRCPAGHEYDRANTRICSAGKRHCRACARARWHARKASA